MVMAPKQSRQLVARNASRATSQRSAAPVWNAEPLRAAAVPASMEQPIGFDFTRLRVHGDAARPAPGGDVAHRSLRVSQPGDALEREADRVADAIMAGSAGDQRVSAAAGAPVQRKCASCSAGLPCANGCAPEESEVAIQRTAAPGPSSPVVAPSALPHAMSAGSPLPPAVRADMEQRSGFDFASVRIHSDSDAARSARDLSARAYTVGDHIVFGAGEYQPGSTVGRRLLAHELAHVVQQRSGVGRGVQRQPADPKKEPPEVLQAREELATLEQQWTQLKKLAGADAVAAQWLASGDEVIRLLRDHTRQALAAIASQDSSRSMEYRSVIETDVLAYRFAVWHAFLYWKIDRLGSRPDELLRAFQRDDRAFTGRDRAQDEVTVLKRLVDSVSADSKSNLALLKTNIAYKLPISHDAITLTSAGDKSIRARMTAEIDAVIKLDQAVDLTVNDVNAFLITARHEGFNQAVEAVEEFYKIKQFLDAAKNIKPDNKQEKQEAPGQQQDTSKKKDTDKREDLGPEPHVPLAPAEDEKKRRKCAIPINCKEAGWKQMGGDLVFAYTYESSTGFLGDLKDCEIWENVAYPGGNPFVWPNPPWDDTWVNPTVHTMAPGPQGKFVDRHRPPQWAKTLGTADVSATQFYFFVCPCATGKLPVTTEAGKLKDNFVIRRRVLLNRDGTTYRYVINKSGGNAQIDPIKP